MNNFYEITVAGARRYAAADKSDPFTFDRCMSHLKSGIVHPYTNESGGRDDMIYDAQPATEMRQVELSTGMEAVPFTVYRNIRRP